jgi:hypothetical protein
MSAVINLLIVDIEIKINWIWSALQGNNNYEPSVVECLNLENPFHQLVKQLLQMELFMY